MADKTSEPTTKSTKKAKASTGASATAAKAQNISSLTIEQLTQLIASEVGKAVGGISSGGKAGVHVNSGPPGFVNGGGHANFDPKLAASPHVNSGPPGFVNGGGHANFDPKVAGSQIASRVGSARSHVNSGPPGFVNGGGHANFDPSGPHVNSGPPGFVNGGGHANFDPKLTSRFAQVSLPDGSLVHIPATGPIDIIVRGFRIKR